MKKHMWFLLTVLVFCVLIACGKDVKQNRDEESGEKITNHTQQAAGTTEAGLAMSDWYISIRAGEKEAVFQLYDTSAAEKLYEQLPLTFIEYPLGINK